MSFFLRGHSVNGINPDFRLLSSVKRMTTPRPVLGMRHQSALDWIHVHVVELLDFLFPSPDIEVVKSALPEAAQTCLRGFVPETQLRSEQALAAVLAEFS